MNSPQPLIAAIYNDIKTQFRASSSGIYIAKPIQEIIRSQSLEGCQDWGTLWIFMLREEGLPATYIQCVDIDWLNKTQPNQKISGWSGHVFIQTRIEGDEIIFDSTGSRRVECIVRKQDFEIYDEQFVVLFKAVGAMDVGAETEEGINPLLQELIKNWHDQN